MHFPKTLSIIVRKHPDYSHQLVICCLQCSWSCELHSRVFALPIQKAKLMITRRIDCTALLINSPIQIITYPAQIKLRLMLRDQLFPNFPLKEDSGDSCHLYKLEQKINIRLLNHCFCPYIVISYYLYQSHSIYKIFSLHIVLKLFFYLLNKHITMHDVSPRKNI